MRQKFDEIAGRSGTAKALNAIYGGYGKLPEEKFPGEFHEAVGLKELDEDVETHIRANYLDA